MPVNAFPSLFRISLSKLKYEKKNYVLTLLTHLMHSAMPRQHNDD